LIFHSGSTFSFGIAVRLFKVGLVESTLILTMSDVQIIISSAFNISAFIVLSQFFRLLASISNTQFEFVVVSKTQLQFIVIFIL